MTHFQSRMKERCDIKLTPSNIKYIIESIQNGKASFIERKSKYITKWQIFIQGEFYYVLYNKRHKILMTVYPEF